MSNPRRDYDAAELEELMDRPILEKVYEIVRGMRHAEREHRANKQTDRARELRSYADLIEAVVYEAERAEHGSDPPDLALKERWEI